MVLMKMATRGTVLVGELQSRTTGGLPIGAASAVACTGIAPTNCEFINLQAWIWVRHRTASLKSWVPGSRS